jgi:hypothetical protein
VVPKKRANSVEVKSPVRIVGADSDPEYICGPTNEKPPPEVGEQVVVPKQISNIPSTELLTNVMAAGIIVTGEPFRSYLKFENATSKVEPASTFETTGLLFTRNEKSHGSFGPENAELAVDAENVPAPLIKIGAADALAAKSIATRVVKTNILFMSVCLLHRTDSVSAAAYRLFLECSISAAPPICQ